MIFDDQQLFCEVCGTWQHRHCYGWVESYEPVRPLEHVCYSCLLLPAEKEVNDVMPVIVKGRNVLNVIDEKCGGIKNGSQRSRTTPCQSQWIFPVEMKRYFRLTSSRR